MYDPPVAHCPFVSLLAFAPGVLVVSVIGFLVFDFDMCVFDICDFDMCDEPEVIAPDAGSPPVVGAAVAAPCALPEPPVPELPPLPLPPPACANTAPDIPTSVESSSACEIFIRISLSRWPA